MSMPQTAEQLIHRLLDVLDRREEEYLRVMDNQDPETKVSFTARASEVGIFRTDLEMLLDRLVLEDNGSYTYKGYRATIKQSEGVFHGTLEGIKDTITFEGDTLEQAKNAFADSVEDYLDFCESRGEQPQKPKTEKN